MERSDLRYPAQVNSREIDIRCVLSVMGVSYQSVSRGTSLLLQILSGITSRSYRPKLRYQHGSRLNLCRINADQKSLFRSEGPVNIY